MSANALDSLPGSCKESCRLAIDYAHPGLNPCIYGSFFNSYLNACLELKCRNKADDPNAVSTYILAQVYDQLKACGPDSWAWQYLNRVATGYSAASTTYPVTSWGSATVTLADGKEVVSSSAVLTRMVTEKFWVQEGGQVAATGTIPTTAGETPSATGAEITVPADPVGTQGSSGSQSDNGTSAPSSSSSNPSAGIIAGCVIAGVALWVLSIFAAVWVYKRRKRRKDVIPKVEGEDGGTHCGDFERPRAVEISTPKEAVGVEVGEGEIYEIGIHEAFELDAAETEHQGSTGRLDAAG